MRLEIEGEIDARALVSIVRGGVVAGVVTSVEKVLNEQISADGPPEGQVKLIAQRFAPNSARGDPAARNSSVFVLSASIAPFNAKRRRRAALWVMRA